MSRELIPVVLKFIGIALDSSVQVTFTTEGVAWCVGARSGDSLGFSYNAGAGEGGFPSCIRQITFNHSTLAIRTAGNGETLNSFVLTLFLSVEAGTDFLQGYATLNNGGRIVAYFGNERGAQWRNGRISALLRVPDNSCRNVVFAFEGVRPGNTIAVEVHTKEGAGAAYWGLGPKWSEGEGITLYSDQATLPLASMSYGTNRIVFQTAPGGTTDSLRFGMEAYLSWHPSGLRHVYFKAHCDEAISVHAQIGNRQPQVVGQTYTLFTL